MKAPGDRLPTMQEAWEADPARFCFDIGIHLREWEQELLREAMAKRAPRNKWEAKKLARIEKRITARLEVLRKETTSEQDPMDGEDGNPADGGNALPEARLALPV